MTGNADDNRQYRDLFDTVIARTLNNAIQFVAHDPAFLLTGISILRHQKHAAAIRQKYEKEGILVPAVMMVSVTSRCNLACKGCYQRAQHRTTGLEMTREQLRSIVAQADDLGVSVIVFAGGEPLLKKDMILPLAKDFPSILFPVFTNGQLIDRLLAEEIGRIKNLVPVLSFEGFRTETDLRRGNGVYDRLLATCSLLKENGVFFGCSITIIRANFERVLDEKFVRSMLDAGARTFVYVEYVPVEPGTEDRVLVPEQRSTLHAHLATYMKRFPALFIGFPGEEEAYGGCLAAGRGFIHVSPSGSLEPCPAAPFSDVNLTAVAVKDALKSEFLEKIRAEHGRLTETQGGCALWTNRDWVEGLLANR
jgi:MoaA/NifB/PqqE/SkfB family radical SAM enzyme